MQPVEQMTSLPRLPYSLKKCMKITLFDFSHFFYRHQSEKLDLDNILIGINLTLSKYFDGSDYNNEECDN